MSLEAQPVSPKSNEPPADADDAHTSDTVAAPNAAPAPAVSVAIKAEVFAEESATPSASSPAPVFEAAPPVVDIAGQAPTADLAGAASAVQSGPEATVTGEGTPSVDADPALVQVRAARIGSPDPVKVPLGSTPSSLSSPHFEQDKVKVEAIDDSSVTTAPESVPVVAAVLSQPLSPARPAASDSAPADANPAPASHPPPVAASGRAEACYVDASSAANAIHGATIPSESSSMNIDAPVTVFDGRSLTQAVSSPLAGVPAAVQTDTPPTEDWCVHFFFV